MREVTLRSAGAAENVIMRAQSQATHEGERGSDPVGGSRTKLQRYGNAGAGVLGTALVAEGLRRRSVGGVAAGVVGGLLLWRALQAGLTESDSDARLTEVSRSITVAAPAEQLYEAWRDPSVLEQTMGHFATVESIGGDSHRWSVHAPAGRTLSWETEVVQAEPGEVLRWASRPEQRIEMDGTVRFEPAAGDRGTRVALSLRFDPPGGQITATLLNRLKLAPETLVGVALSRFKSLVETGEIPTLEGNPSARGGGDAA